jgi:hypothetical protein
MMTSMFESAVYARARQTPWARVDPIRFMRDMALESDGETVGLTVNYRHSVASRFWWTISWAGPDGERHEAEAQTLDRCLWRAAEIQLQLEAKRKENKDSEQRPD